MQRIGNAVIDRTFTLLITITNRPYASLSLWRRCRGNVTRNQSSLITLLYSVQDGDCCIATRRGCLHNKRLTGADCWSVWLYIEVAEGLAVYSIHVLHGMISL